MLDGGQREADSDTKTALELENRRIQRHSQGRLKLNLRTGKSLLERVCHLVL